MVFGLAMIIALHLPIIALLAMQSALEGASFIETIVQVYPRLIIGQLDVWTILGVGLAVVCWTIAERSKMIFWVTLLLSVYLLMGSYVVGARAYGGLGGL